MDNMSRLVAAVQRNDREAEELARKRVDGEFLSKFRAAYVQKTPQPPQPPKTDTEPPKTDTEPPKTDTEPPKTDTEPPAPHKTPVEAPRNAPEVAPPEKRTPPARFKPVSAKCSKNVAGAIKRTGKRKNGRGRGRAGK